MDSQLMHQNGTNPPNNSVVEQVKKKISPTKKWILALSLIGNLLMIVFGGLGVNKCPINEKIPIFLIATGVLGIITKIVAYGKNRLDEPHKMIKYTECVLHLAENFCIGFGAVVVFRAYKPSYNPSDDKSYCDKTAYLFAFIYLVVYITILIATLLGFLCFFLCAYFLSKTAERDVEAHRTESCP